MKKMIIEMPVVTECTVSACAYNVGRTCHARAITVGDGTRPGCDTYLMGARHTGHAQQVAGIGACKIVGCKFNEDFECVAETIRVGMVRNEPNCLSFALA